MSSRRAYSYSKMDKEDPEERKHRIAQFLIYKALEEAESRRRQPCVRVRICRLTVKIGRRLKKLRRSIQINFGVARAGVYRQVMGQLKVLKCMLRGKEDVVSLPPLFG